MSMRHRLLPVLLALASLTRLAGAEAEQLSKETLARAQKIDSLTIPTAGEVLAAINKQAKPNWQSLYRPPIPTAYSSRPQIALNIGGLIADGYIAIEAEDSQQVKNLGRDIISLAKSLGVSQNILSRGSSITDFAENNQWSTLKEELEATQNEVKMAMTDQHDEELVTLVSLGGWIRGTEAVSSFISDNYTPGLAKLIRQPALVAYLRGKIKELPPRQQEDSLVKSVDRQLDEIENLVTFPRDAVPSLAQVKQLRDISNQLIKQISMEEPK